MKRNPYNRLFDQNEDANPLSYMANLFDVAMVFAVALMVALVSSMGLKEFLSNERFTMIKNPGQPNMEIITKEGEQMTRYKATELSNDASKKGKKIGTAYQLEDGQIIYVPD